MPPLWRRVCHAVAHTEALRYLSDRGFRGKAKEGQRASEGPPGGPTLVFSEGLLGFPGLPVQLRTGNSTVYSMVTAVGVFAAPERHRDSVISRYAGRNENSVLIGCWRGTTRHSNL